MNGLQQIEQELATITPGDELAEGACRCLLQLCFPAVLPRLNQHFDEPEWIRDMRQEHRDDPQKLLRLAGALCVKAIESSKDG